MFESLKCLLKFFLCQLILFVREGQKQAAFFVAHPGKGAFLRFQNGDDRMPAKLHPFIGQDDSLAVAGGSDRSEADVAGPDKAADGRIDRLLRQGPRFRQGILRVNIVGFTKRIQDPESSVRKAALQGCGVIELRLLLIKTVQFNVLFFYYIVQ